MLQRQDLHITQRLHTQGKCYEHVGVMKADECHRSFWT